MAVIWNTSPATSEARAPPTASERLPIVMPATKIAVRQRGEPGDRPAQGRGVRHSQKQVESPAAAHDRGPEPGAFQPGVIAQNGERQHGRQQRRSRPSRSQAPGTGPAPTPALPSQAAVRLEARPEGSGRPGRSRRSTSKSKTSLSIVPDAYSTIDAGQERKPSRRERRVTRSPAASPPGCRPRRSRRSAAASVEDRR